MKNCILDYLNKNSNSYIKMGVTSNKNNAPIVVNIKYSKLEKLINELKKNSDNLSKSKIKSFEELEKNGYMINFINLQDEINKELMNIRKSISSNTTNMGEYSKSTVKLKKYIFEIQNIVKNYFEIIKDKTKYFNE